ncbi:phosphatidylethanolamine N-methyltransferase isoform X2 [Meleagris gallopavo]|uniref:phosphatidylethanolamine N-methyltransferase isoform X2 n=1 Tax=Meleagris gallopavo TaxID=9103 RepID=UPI000549DB78|nr:phosphatidylethanolamine N-methyltransferase isoform X2 [Meleagris gallopavo]
MARVFSYVDVTDSGFIAAVLSIAFNPFFWNVARWEHKTRALSRGFGSPHTACYCLGIVILLLNCVRSHCQIYSRIWSSAGKQRDEMRWLCSGEQTISINSHQTPQVFLSLSLRMFPLPCVQSRWQEGCLHSTDHM